MKTVKFHPTAYCKTALSAALLLSCLTAGCAGPDPENDPKAVYQPRERTEFDLSSSQWAEQKDPENSGEPWQYTKYWEDAALKSTEPDSLFNGRWSVANHSDLYWLECRLSKDKDEPPTQTRYLTHLNTVTMEAERTEFQFSEPSGETGNPAEKLPGDLIGNFDKNQLIILGMDIVDEKICLLTAQMDSEGKSVSHYYVIWTNMQGVMESATDLFPEAKRSGMLRDNSTFEGILCDQDGYLYVENPLLGSFGLFDRDGNFLKTVESPEGSDQTVFHMGRLPDGRPVFGCSEADSTILFCYEDGKAKVLYQGRCNIPQQAYFNEYGEILYMENGWLMRWDAATGKCLQLYRENEVTFRENTNPPLRCEAIIENSDREITLVFNDVHYGVTLAIWLELDPEIEERTLTIFQMNDNQELRKRMAEYQRRHPGVSIELASPDPDEDFDMALTRLMAQLSQNKGPDMFLLRLDQLEILQGEGVLADLTGVLPKETEEQIFPGVLRCGMVDGTLYGLVNNVAAGTVIVSQKVWPEDTWTWRDVMALTEGGGQNGDGFASVFGDEQPLELLKTLILRDVAAGTSSFLDYERKQCSFDSEDFIRILEFCQKYGSAPGTGENSFEEQIKKVQGGDALAYPSSGGLLSFSRDMAALGEGYKCIGYPTDGEYGGYFECHYCLSVNADSPNQDLAYDVLRYLLGEEGQRQTGIFSVRRDILSRCVEDGTEPEYEPVFRLGENAVTPLGGRPDGSSFLPEYMEILEKGTSSLPFGTAELIIVEEAAVYFAGDRTSKETAEIIQNRVQLYLNER